MEVRKDYNREQNSSYPFSFRLALPLKEFSEVLDTGLEIDFERVRMSDCPIRECHCIDGDRGVLCDIEGPTHQRGVDEQRSVARYETENLAGILVLVLTFLQRAVPDTPYKYRR